MVYHEELEHAGKEPGLQVWRIEQMELTPVPPQLHGQFYTGDSYLVLHTTSGFSYNVHVWFGKETSQDERGSAAIYMVQLDDRLNGKAVQHTEHQDHESKSFMGYFKRTGVTYKKGGVASGFSHVVTNDMNVKRLLHVKGRRMIRATEVDMSWSGFNNGDCFIIDFGKTIYNWAGSQSNHFERLKANEVAKAIRDNERNGRSTVEMIDEGSEPEEVIGVLGPKPDLPPASCDHIADVKSKNEASLFLISDASGSMETTLVAEKTPFKQDMLSSSECYILDNKGDEKIFVWKGQDANEEERKVALCTAEKFIEIRSYSPNTQINILPQWGETSLFKQFFLDWMDKDETVGLGEVHTINKIAKVEKIPFDVSKLHDKTMAAQHGMVDDGSGKVQIWRVEGNDKKPVDPQTYGQFYGGDCYLVQYSYNDGGREKHIIYIWQGQKCSSDELGASAILAIELDDSSLGGAATQVRVTQGQEPNHLMSLFNGKPLMVYLGGTSRKSDDKDEEPANTRLFHIRQGSTGATRAVEVEPDATSLNTNDVFVLKNGDSMYQWNGKGATSEEKAAAQDVVERISVTQQCTQKCAGKLKVMNENEESDDFWKALGGKKRYQCNKALRNAVWQPRLFGCSNKTGTVNVEEVPGDITQADLAPDDVMILDTGEQLFLWNGKDANKEERCGSWEICKTNSCKNMRGRITKASAPCLMVICRPCAHSFC
ncbi:scinderin like a isoform X2 [Plectropomus leopardus]|uniref:scinderin like a isoform X2 n=1 Tax=Plectropomus leopardus TaxID=160734 RepID=UPI001C4AFD71|nr:scinderin like a isoform X2 [Plectropomus leopardus]